MMLSGSHDASLPGQARNLGLMAFLPKTLEPVEIAGVIGMLAGGGLVSSRRRRAGHAALDTAPGERVAGGGLGQANKHIARSLGVSESTVKFHLEEGVRAPGDVPPEQRHPWERWLSTGRRRHAHLILEQFDAALHEAFGLSTLPPTRMT